MVEHPGVNKDRYYFIGSNVLFNLKCKTIFKTAGQVEDS